MQNRNKYTQHTRSSMFGKKAGKIATTITTALSFAGVASSYAGLIYASVREHDISSDKFKDDCNGRVKNSEDFTVIGKPTHGTLNPEIIKDKQTGEQFVKKGAHSRADFVKEYMFANFSHSVRSTQPQSYIYQTTDANGKTHFYNLSAIAPDSQDVEDFIRAGRTQELTESEVIGLEATLATNQILGKQSDLKFANMVVQESANPKTKKKQLTFSDIDNERGVSIHLHFLDSTYSECPTTTAKLLGSILDTHDKSEDNTAGLAGDPRAGEFSQVAKSVITPERIAEFYETFANTDTKPVIDDCHLLANHSRLFKHEECEAYHELFEDMQKRAKQTASEMKLEAFEQRMRRRFI